MLDRHFGRGVKWPTSHIFSGVAGKFVWFFLPILICLMTNFGLLAIIIHKIYSLDAQKKQIMKRGNPNEDSERY